MTVSTAAENARTWRQDNPFEIYTHLVCREIDETTALFEVEVTEELLNRHSTVHGGMIYTLADSTTGALVHTDGRQYVTLDTSFHFIRSVGSGFLRARASLIHRGRTTAYLEVRVTNEDGLLLANGTFTYFCIG